MSGTGPPLEGSGRTDRDAPGVEIRVLGASTHVTFDPEVAGVLAPTLVLAASGARQPPGPTERLDLRAVAAGSGGGGAVDLPMFALQGPDGARSMRGDPLALLGQLLADVERRAALTAGAVAVLRASCARVGGMRVLFTGWGSPGITTLLLELGRRGHRIESDHRVLLTRSGFAAVTRRVLVRRHTAAVLPWLEAELAAAPWFENRSGEAVHAVDLNDLGMEWEAGVGPVDAVVEVDGNHGGTSRVRPAPTWRAIRSLAESAVPTAPADPSGGESPTGPGGADPGPDPGRDPAWIARLSQAVAGARGVDLRLGDPVRAADLLADALAYDLWSRTA